MVLAVTRAFLTAGTKNGKNVPREAAAEADKPALPQLSLHSEHNLAICY